jgi:hypothetical protein
VIRLLTALLLAAGLVSAQDTEWDTAIGQKDQVTKGLVGYWAMRNSGTTVFDEHDANNGTAILSPDFAYANGVVGNGVLLNGSSQYIAIGTDLYESYQTGTITAWIYPTSMVQRLSILSSSVAAKHANFLQFGVYEATQTLAMHDRTKNDNNFVLSSPTALQSNVWAHVAVTTSGSAYRFWINGVEQTVTNLVGTNSGAWFGDFSADTHDVNIGKRQRADDTYWFAGKLDEVRIWNIALTSDEIKRLYLMGKVIYENR